MVSSFKLRSQHVLVLDTDICLFCFVLFQNSYLQLSLYTFLGKDFSEFRSPIKVLFPFPFIFSVDSFLKLLLLWFICLRISDNWKWESHGLSWLRFSVVFKEEMNQPFRIILTAAGRHRFHPQQYKKKSLTLNIRSASQREGECYLGTPWYGQVQPKRSYFLFHLPLRVMKAVYQSWFVVTHHFTGSSSLPVVRARLFTSEGLSNRFVGCGESDGWFMSLCLLKCLFVVKWKVLWELFVCTAWVAVTVPVLFHRAEPLCGFTIRGILHHNNSICLREQLGCVSVLFCAWFIAWDVPGFKVVLY